MRGLDVLLATVRLVLGAPLLLLVAAGSFFAPHQAGLIRPLTLRHYLRYLVQSVVGKGRGDAVRY